MIKKIFSIKLTFIKFNSKKKTWLYTILNISLHMYIIFQSKKVA